MTKKKQKHSIFIDGSNLDRIYVNHAHIIWIQSIDTCICYDIKYFNIYLNKVYNTNYINK